MSSSPKFNKNIAGLRGFSAFFIVILHTYVGPRDNGWFLVSATGPLHYLNFCISSLEVCVEVFFMISGYLILATLNKKPTVWMFFIDRITRLFPTFLILNTIVFILSIIIRTKHVSGFSGWGLFWIFIANSFMLPGIFSIPAILEVSWSLSYEWVFYICSAICKDFVYRNFVAKAAVVVILVWLLWHYPRGVFFLSGVIVYYMDTRGYVWNSTISKWGIFCLIPFLGLEEAAIRGLGGRLSDFLYFAAFLFSLPAFVSVVHGRSWTTAPLRAEYAQWLGAVSYSLYLVHIIIEFPLKRLVHHLMIHAPAAAQVGVLGIILIPASLGAAHMSHELLEKRLSGRLRIRWERRYMKSLNAKASIVGGSSAV